MKNKILKLIVVIVIAVMAVFNWGLVSKSSDLSDASLANIEVLASGETSLCPTGCVSGGIGCFCYEWYWDERPPINN